MEIKADLIANSQISFQQIISLVSLMIEVNNYEMSNLLTIRDLAERGLSELKKSQKI